MMTFSAFHTVQVGGNELNISSANPRAIARLSAAGYRPPVLLSANALYRVMQAQQGAGAADEVRQFAGVAYSGGPVPYGMGAVVIDLASTKAPAPMPLLHAHDHAAVIGKVASVTNNGQQLSDAGELFTDIDPLALGIVQRADRGTPFQQSVGIYDYTEEFIPAGHVVDINGRTLQGPLTVMRNGTVREISLCPLGADAKTSAAFFDADQRAPTQGRTFTARVPMSTARLYRSSN
jgi:hypothetical protein